MDFLFHPTGWLCFIIHFVHSLLALPYTDGEEKNKRSRSLSYSNIILTLWQTSAVYNCLVKPARFRGADFLKNDFPPTFVFLRFFHSSISTTGFIVEKQCCNALRLLSSDKEFQYLIVSFFVLTIVLSLSIVNTKFTVYTTICKDPATGEIRI